MKLRFFPQSFGGHGPPKPSCEVIGIPSSFLLAGMLENVYSYPGISPQVAGNHRAALYIFDEIALLLEAARNPYFHSETYDSHRFFERIITHDKIMCIGDPEYLGVSPSGERWIFEINHSQYLKALIFWREYLLGGLGEEYTVDLDVEGIA